MKKIKYTNMTICHVELVKYTCNCNNSHIFRFSRSVKVFLNEIYILHFCSNKTKINAVKSDITDVISTHLCSVVCR